MEDGIDTLLGGQREVPFEIPGIAFVVFSGPKLQRVHENGDYRSVTTLACPADEAQVPFVKGTHSGNQSEGTSACLLFLDPTPSLRDRAKDAQQALIIRTMVLNLNWSLQIEVCPTVREADGLAYSSRNRYLSVEERTQATVLYRSLRLAESLIHSGERNAASVEQQIQKQIQQVIRAVPEAEIDYARVVDPATLEGLQQIRGEVLAVVAVRFGKTRLIDNLSIIAPERQGGSPAN